MKQVFAAILVLFISALLPAGSLPRQMQNQVPWTPVWADEFNAAAKTGVNTRDWLYDLGTGYGCAGCPSNWGTGEVESMTNSTLNVYHDGEGHLAIAPVHTGDDPRSGWTSGRIETVRTDFSAPLGGVLAVEASIQQPNVTGEAALGYWPAFWMLGGAFRGNYRNWPGIGEIDIMENINGLSSVFGVFHCGTFPGGPCNEPNGRGSGQRRCEGCQTGFHTYRAELDRSISPQEIRWYLDGINYFTVNSGQFDETTWANATSSGFFILLNVAMGGGFPAAFGGGPTAATASGVPMLIDYVRVSVQHRRDAFITGITPAFALQGQTTRAVITGMNLTDASAVTISGTGVTATIEAGGTPTSLPVTITIGSGASVGVRTVTITTPTGISNSFTGLEVGTRLALVPYSVVKGGGRTLTSSGTSPIVRIGYASLQSDFEEPLPAALEILSFREKGVLVSETSVAAAPLLQTGRIYAEMAKDTQTGLAIANPNNHPATLSFFFTSSSGNLGAGEMTIPAKQQVAAFLDQFPFGGPSSFEGTFTFTVSAPISAVAFRGFTNERSEFLMSTVVTADLGIPPASTCDFPHFATGGGWTTEILLFNPTDTVLVGNVEFRNPAGQSALVTANDKTNHTFGYSLAAREAQKLRILDPGAAALTGSVRVAPELGTIAPVGQATFSLRSNGITSVQTSIACAPIGTAFRVFAEMTGDFGHSAAGSLQTGIAIANPSPGSAAILVEVYGLDGSTTGLTGTLSIPAQGQAAMFLNQVVESWPLAVPFKGVLRVSAGTPISVIGFRARINERGEFLITTTPSVDEFDPLPAISGRFFGHVVDGGGYRTEFILLARSPNDTSSGTIRLISQTGGSLSLTLQSSTVVKD